MKAPSCIAFILLYVFPLFPAGKPHTVTLGRQSTAKIQIGDTDADAIGVKIRPLLVDGQLKEYLVGPVHEVTSRTFVVQRVFRLNDSLPQETGNRWKWQRGGWIQVDHVTGRVQPLSLQFFEPALSAVSWFRDYAAYCGLSDDGHKAFAVVAQLGRRKPLLKSQIESPEKSSTAICGMPEWQRDPARVTFLDQNQQRMTFSITSRAIDLTTATDDEDKE